MPPKGLKTNSETHHLYLGMSMKRLSSQTRLFTQNDAEIRRNLLLGKPPEGSTDPSRVNL